MIIQLTPQTFTIPGKGTVTITQLSVVPSNYNLGVSFSGYFQVMDANGTMICDGINALSSDQFAGWLGDDTYVANTIAANLGLTPAPAASIDVRAVDDAVIAAAVADITPNDLAGKTQAILAS